MFEFIWNETLYQIVEYSDYCYNGYLWVKAYGALNTSLQITGHLCKGDKWFNYYFINDDGCDKMPVTDASRLVYGGRKKDGSVAFKRVETKLYAPSHVSVSVLDGFTTAHRVKKYYFHHTTDGDYFEINPEYPDRILARRYDLDPNQIGLYKIETEKGLLVKEWTRYTKNLIVPHWTYQANEKSLKLELLNMNMAALD